MLELATLTCIIIGLLAIKPCIDLYKEGDD